MTSTFFWLPATYRGAVVLAILSLPLLIGCSDSKQPITAESSDFKAEDRVDQADSAPAPSAEGSGSGSGDPGSRDPGSREPASGSAAGPEGRGKREPDRAGGVEAGVGDGGPPVQPPSRSQRQLDSLEVPEGPPEQLLAFIQQVENWQPPAGMSQKEAFETMQTIMGAQIEAAERILAHPQATDPQRRTAFDVKLSVLNNLHLLGVQESRDHLVEFVEAIQSDRDPEMARAGRLMSFNFRLEESVRQEVDDPQMASLVKELKTLLDEEPHTSQVLNFLGTAALEMLRAGYSEQGREAIDAIVKAFQDAEPAVAEASQGLLEQAKIHQVGFDQKRSAFVQSKPESMRPLLDAVNTLLTGENAGPTTLTLAFQVADDLERAQEFEAARNLYDAIEAEFSDVENEEVRMFARQTVQNARKRLGLLNEPLALEGTKLDGSPLDWSKYEGEVVLVNFWSTQDANSIRELSNIIELREKYQNKDFAVIGVNMDQDQESVERFFALQSPLPWVTVVDAASGEDQLAERVGVGMLPFSLLLDREGKVAALHVSGPKLQEHVEKLLGPPAANFRAATKHFSWRSSTTKKPKRPT